jgi:hypothetical protein
LFVSVDRLREFGGDRKKSGALKAKEIPLENRRHGNEP